MTLNLSLLPWWSLSLVLVSQLGPTPCDPRDCSPPGSSVHGISQARIPGWVAISPEVFLTQGSNSGLLHCRKILYHLSHQRTHIQSGDIIGDVEVSFAENSGKCIIDVRLHFFLLWWKYHDTHSTCIHINYSALIMCLSRRDIFELK